MSVILGSRIRKVRVLKKISIVELSLKTGISKEKIKKLENGQVPISVEELNKICKVIQISRKKLFDNH